jgi:hypothetical protein
LKNFIKAAFLVFVAAFSLYAQDLAQNSVYIEGLGNGGLYSLNYERIINERFSVRLGASYVDLSGSMFGLGGNASFPVLANYFLFSKRDQLELGVGFVLVVNHQESFDIFQSQPATGTSYIGFRDEDPQSHLLFRVGCSQFYTSERIYFSGGISLGFLF